MKRTDVRSALDAASISRFQWLVIGLVALITLFDGYDTFIPAYMIHYVAPIWRLRPSAAGLLVSSGLVGFMIGALCQGAVSDRIGRKPTLCVALGLAGLFSAATALFSLSFTLFLILRVLTGLGLGVLLPLSVAYINELSPRRWTNLIVGVVMIGWSAGGVLAALVGIALTPTFGWSVLFWLGGAALPLALVCAVALPESAQYLALQGRQEELRKLMRRIDPGRTITADEVFVTEGDRRRAGAFIELLSPAYRRDTLLIWLCSALSLFTIFGLSSWVPNLMMERGSGFATGFGLGALLQVMAILGGVGVGWAADRWFSRRTALALSWAAAAAAIVTLAAVRSPFVDAICISAAGFFVMGAQPVLNNFAASLYGTEIRSTGVGVELGIGRIGGILGPYVGGLLQQVIPGTASPYAAMGAACAASLVLILFASRGSTTSPSGDVMFSGH